MPKYSVSDYIDRLEDVRREKNSKTLSGNCSGAVGVGVHAAGSSRVWDDLAYSGGDLEYQGLLL